MYYYSKSILPLWKIEKGELCLRTAVGCLRPMTLRPHEGAMHCSPIVYRPGGKRGPMGQDGPGGSVGEGQKRGAKEVRSPSSSSEADRAHAVPRNLRTRTYCKNTSLHQPLLLTSNASITSWEILLSHRLFEDESLYKSLFWHANLEFTPAFLYYNL